jgi:hypothetical protein
VLNFYTDAGKSNVSNGFYVKSAVIGTFKTGKYAVEGGFQADLAYKNRSAFSGLTVSMSKDIMLKSISFTLEGFLLRTKASDITGETNWGVLLKTGRNHFKTMIGINFRTYSFTRFAIREYKLDKGTARCHDVYNFMYAFTYDLKTEDSFWNAGMTITDSDHFVINQENNITFNLHGSYKLSPSVFLYTQAWYQAAGITNLKINNFAFILRTGIIWNIN